MEAKAARSGLPWYVHTNLSRQRDSELSRHGARRLSLLVRTGHKYGMVRVYLGRALLTTVQTRGRVDTKVFELAHFSRPRTGMVRIVTTSRRTVKIDGLGVL